MIKINLLAEGKKPVVARKSAMASGLKVPQELALWIIGALVLVAILGVAGYWFKLRADLGRINEQTVAAKKEIKELEPILKEVDEYKGKKVELEHKIQVINDLKANQRGPVQIMDYVSRAVPELLWIDRLDMRGSTIALKGRAFNTNAVAALLENLGKVPEFKEPVLKDTQRRGPLYTYDITFSFSFAKPPAENASGAGAEAAPAKAAAKS